MIKRLFAILCAMTLIFSAVEMPNSAIAAERENELYTAEVVFDSATPAKNGFATVEPGTDTSPLMASRGGKSAWLMDKLQNNAKSTINFTLSDTVKPKEFDGSIYDIEVEYFDSGKGYCFLFYNNTDGDREYKNAFYTNATGTWKTKTFTLTNADFNEKSNGKYDFYLSIKSRSTKIPISDESIAVRRVKVTRRPNVNKLYVSTVIDEPGNTFKWFSEDKIVKATVHNYSGADANAEIKFKAVTDSGFNKGEITENISIPKDESKELELNFGNIDYCDIYGLYAEVKMSDGTVTEQMPTKFAIIKTDPNGIKNEEVMFASHPDWRENDVIPEGIELMAMSNVAGMRQTISDKLIDVVAPILKENGLKLLPIYLGIPKDVKVDPTASNAWAEMPFDERGYEGWRRNVVAWTTKLKDVVDRYEIWNEPNITSFNKFLDKCQGDVYTEVCRIAKEEIDRIDPGSILGGPSITGITITATWDEAGKPYFDDCMDKGMWKYVDALVLHPYTSNSAEKADMITSMKYYQDEFTKVGKPNAEVWNTETGYTTVDKTIGSEKVKGMYNSRAALLYKINHVSDLTVFYNFEKKGTVEIDREDQFGHVSPPFKDCKEWGTMYFPRESYLMVAGLNYLMAQSTADSVIDSGDENINVFTYDSQKFNKKIAAMYCADDKERIAAFKIDADKLNVYDSKGNKSELYGENGVFTFNLSADPIYIMGDISKIEAADSNIIEMGDTDIEAAYGDTFSIGVSKNTDKDLKLAVDLPNKAEVAEIGSFKDGKADVKIKNKAEIGESYSITLYAKDGEKTVFKTTYNISSNIPVMTTMGVSMNGTNYNSWNGTLDITNISSSKTLKGHIEFKQGDLAAKLKNVDIGIIPPNSTGRVEFGLGTVYKKGQYAMEYDVVTEDGSRYPFVGNFDLSVAKYADKKPVIDGKFDKNEWDSNTAMYADKADQIRQIKDWRGKTDVSGNCMLMWDEDNLYLAAEVTDDIFSPAPSGANQWKGDDIQFGVYYGSAGFLAIGQASTTYHELGFALTADGPQAYRWLAQDNAVAVGAVEDLELAVVNEGQKTYYEARIPWTTLLKPGQQPKAGHEMAFSFLLNDNDGDGRRGWIEYTSGIGEAKNTELFARIKLLK